MPRLSHKPIPKKRFHGGRWRIYWKWDFDQYSIATNYLDPRQETAVNSDLRLISAALAMDDPEFPEAYSEAPAVQKYLLARYNRNEQSEIPKDPDWLAAYKSTLYNETSKRWADRSMRYLNNLAKYCSGDIRLTTASQAQEYLNSILSTGRSPGTRNRALAACSRFYKWAIQTRRAKRNPFSGIKLLPENNYDDIVYCTRAEREEIITLAKESGWQDWLAIPVAFYSGMRREEICRLLWSDIRFVEGNFIVRKSKTGKGRQVPINTDLAQLLEMIPEKERSGYVVKMPGDTGDPLLDEVTRPDRLTNMCKSLRKTKEKELMQSWKIDKPRLYRSKPRSLTRDQWNKTKIEYRRLKKHYQSQVDQRKEILKTYLERIGWNVFRHTFGSVLAQEKIGLDKISAWMGNTPEVCRRHYAQFVPRDRRDTDIDKL